MTKQLALVHPPGDGDQHEPEWVENTLRIQSSLSRPPGCGRKPSQIHADPVFGPYEVVLRGGRRGVGCDVVVGIDRKRLHGSSPWVGGALAPPVSFLNG